MKEPPRLLLVVAPSKMECHRTAQEFGLDFSKVEQMRFISDPYHLRGWSRGTPFIALRRDRWPEKLDQVLHALTVMGQLRVANEGDLDALREGFVRPRPSVALAGRVAL